MVFLIQSSQNREAKATHLKLDELIRSSKVRDVFADLEDATEAELDAFKEEFRKLREKRVAPGEAAEVAHRLVHKPRLALRRPTRASHLRLRMDARRRGRA